LKVLQDLIFKLVLRVDMSRGPADETKSGGERVHEQPMDSDRKAKSQRSRARKCEEGCTMYTLPTSTRFGKARWVSKGPAGNMGVPHVPDMCKRGRIQNPSP